MLTSASSQHAGGIVWVRAGLIANAAYAAAGGLEAIVASGSVAGLVGLPMGIVGPLGVVMLGYAALLALTATRPAVNRRAVGLFAVLNALSALASIDILLTGVLPLSEAGRWAMLIVADADAAFALLQFLAWRRMR